MSADAEHLRLIAYHMRQAGFEYHAEFLERLAERIDDEEPSDRIAEKMGYGRTD